MARAKLVGQKAASGATAALGASKAGRRLLSPATLRSLANKLVSTTSRAKADALRERLTRGFYGNLGAA